MRSPSGVVYPPGRLAVRSFRAAGSALEGAISADLYADSRRVQGEQ